MQRKLLYRHFLRTFFVSDLVASQGDAKLTLLLIGAAFASPALLVAFFMGTYGDRVDLSPTTAVFDTLSLLVVGLLTVVQWDSLFPDRVDFMVLRPLPLNTADMFWAKAGALATVLVAVTTVVNASFTVVVPWLDGHTSWTPAHVLRVMSAHALSTGAAAQFAFSSVIGLQGLILAVLGYAGLRRIGPWLQFVLMALLLTALVLLPNLFSGVLLGKIANGRAAVWLPPLWFLGLDRILAGEHPANGEWLVFAHTAAKACVISGLAALGLYVAGYRRQLNEALTADSGGGLHRRGWVGRSAERFVRKPRERAVFNFIGATLTRSRRHLLYLAVWLGAGIAFMVEPAVASIWAAEGPRRTAAAGVVAVLPPMMLTAPLVLTFFLLMGLRHIFAMPIEPRANWVFQLCETSKQPERFEAIWKWMALGTILPAAILTLPPSVALWGWSRAVWQLAGWVAAAVLLLQLLVLRLRKLPFTCTYMPEKGDARQMWLLFGFFTAFYFYAYATAALEQRLQSRPVRLGLLLAAAFAAAGLLGWERRRRMAEGVRGQFDGAPDAFVQTIFVRD